jgi:phosphatidylserine decarboxylase
MVKEVWPWLTGGLVLTLAASLAGWMLVAAACLLLTLFVASFFRDPGREIPSDPRLILSPADGRVVAVSSLEPGAPPGGTVSIFLSVFNVHVNRAPVSGRVSDIRYTPGSFLPAFRDKASELNEQNLIHLETPHGPMAVKQIAGLIARRIRCYKQPGDAVAQGEKIGFITFGSRVDLHLPPQASVRVSVGDRVRGGTSVVAVFAGDEARS